MRVLCDAPVPLRGVSLATRTDDIREKACASFAGPAVASAASRSVSPPPGPHHASLTPRADETMQRFR